MVIPDRLVDAVRKSQDTLVICAPVISQFAAIGALQSGAAWCREKLKGIAEVRALVRSELQSLAPLVEVPPADGAFYFLLRINAPLDSLGLTERLIREHRVAVIPGTAFGLAQGCHLRVAYGSLNRETAAEGIGRLIRGLRQIFGL